MKTAKLVRTLDGFSGDARLFELSDPVTFYGRDTELGPAAITSHVVVSATYVMGVPETYIFPADQDGHVLFWGELEGSFRGDADHALALRQAGYELQ